LEPPLVVTFGIDLRSGPRYPTGIATMTADRRCRSIAVGRRDEAILDAVEACSPRVVAIDAPLALPEGRDCADPACACATAGIMREVDRSAAGGLPPLPQPPPQHGEADAPRHRAPRDARGAWIRGHRDVSGDEQDVLGIPRKGSGV